jgi:steroid delta-isomerase-like uncharacterized protein
MSDQPVALFQSHLTRRTAITRLGAVGLAMVAASRSRGSIAHDGTAPVVDDLPPAVQEYIEGWESLDLERIVGAFAEDAVVDDVVAGVMRTGQEAIRGHVTATIAAFADLRFQVFSAVAADDVVVLEWALTGRYTGMLPGLQPGEGQPVAVRGVHTLELADGRIRVSREYADRGEMLLQLGLAWPTAGYAGQVEGTEAFIAFVTDGIEVRAYVCDGQEEGVTLSEWFRGTADGADIDLPSTSGQAQLTATVTPGAVTGTVAVATEEWTFTALPARDRAGLYAYKGDASTAMVGWTGAMLAREYTGGWIILNPGTEVRQRGAITLGNLLQGNPTLDVTTRAAAIAGEGQVLTGLVTSTNLYRFFTNGWP